MVENVDGMQGGDVVGDRFVIEALAGSGGMGEVYRARDRQTDDVVALKVVGDAASDTRFEQEARVLAELDHPAIVRYVAHGRTTESRPWLAMEWLDGEDLRTTLDRGRLSIDQARTLARRVAEALAIAHTRGIVHRDIKPGNLFLPAGDVSRLKVLDFGIARTGLARALDSTVMPITRTGMVVGTVGYMSPEQARGGGSVDARTDVFALGCVLFESLTGRPAFSGANAVAVLAKVLLEDAPRTRHFEPSVPPAFDELVARMLAKDPTLRPRDAGAVLRALEASATERSSGSSSGGAFDREKRMVTIVLARGIEGALEGAIPLADGAKLIEFGGEDPATRAAAAALRLAKENPRASFAIATGRIADSHAGAYGPIIDRVATLEPRTNGIPIDGVSATLLGDRFEVADGVLVGTTRADSTPRTLLGKNTPYVGRDKELALLEATFRECVGEPIARSVIVTAAAGSGKTRLAHELLARVRSDATVLIARGDPVGAGSALGLARQLVRNAARLHDRDDAQTQHRMLREHLERYFTGDALGRVAEMLGELANAKAPSPSAQLRAARDDARILASWLSRTFAEWIAALSDAAPLLCVIEDLHWGDGASVAWLDDALRANAGRPLMLLALARPEVHDLFPSLWSRANVQELKLQGLTKRASEKLIKSVLADVSDEMVARLTERADGNAFHLEELIRHVAERSVDSLPDTVLALAEARIARLDPEARRFLRVASVFGETFWEPGVLALLEASPSDVLPRLVENEVIVEGPGRKFAREHQFRHGLLRDAAYAMLTDEDRSALHLAAGAWLERAGEQDALVLAEHFERAGARARATPFFFQASQRALESLNLIAARTLAERGIKCGAQGELLGKLKYIQTMAHAAAGEHAQTVRAAKQAYALLPPQSVYWYGSAAYALSSGAYVGDVELAPTIIQDLLTTEPAEPTGPYGFAVQITSDILDSIGQEDASDRLMERALALAMRSDPDPAFRAYVVYARTAMAMRRDRALGEVIAGLGDARLSDAVGELAKRMFDFGGGILKSEVGDTAGARQLYMSALRTLGEAPLFAAWCSIHVAWVEIVEGHYAEAISWARKAFELDPHHAYAAAACAHFLSGDSSEAERLIARAFEGIDDALVTPWVVSTAHAVAARIALGAGRLEEADRLSAKSLPGGGSPYNRSFRQSVRIDVLRALGRDATADIAALVARIDRHSESLPPELRESFRKLPEHAHVLELAQR